MLDRKRLCDAYCDQYPADEQDFLIHYIIGDYNFEDYWLFKTIADLALRLQQDEGNVDLHRRLLFLVDLLRAPMPDAGSE